MDFLLNFGANTQPNLQTNPPKLAKRIASKCRGFALVSADGPNRNEGTKTERQYKKPERGDKETEGRTPQNRNEGRFAKTAL